MNERIRELALEANGPNPFFGTLKNQMTLLGDDAVEKFAELIVKECADWMENEKNEIGDRIGDSFYWSDRMRLHFGVEE